MENSFTLFSSNLHFMFYTNLTEPHTSSYFACIIFIRFYSHGHCREDQQLAGEASPEENLLWVYKVDGVKVLNYVILSTGIQACCVRRPSQL